MKNLIFIMAFLACLSTPAFAEDQKDEVTSNDSVIEKSEDAKETVTDFDFILIPTTGGGDAVSP